MGFFAGGYGERREAMESLERYLRDLEGRIDPAAETALEKNWLLFADGL